MMELEARDDCEFAGDFASLSAELGRLGRFGGSGGPNGDYKENAYPLRKPAWTRLEKFVVDVS